jgi:integration host factor subunit beta
VPEKRVPHFKPGKALREAVDQGPTASVQAPVPAADPPAQSR